MYRRLFIATSAAALLAASAVLDPGVGQADSANPFAVVDAAGNLISGSDGASAVQLGPGQYEVTFDRNVSNCAYVATTSNAFSEAITVFTAGGHLSENGVYVETKNQGGGLTDGPFSLLVGCRGHGSSFAVVGYAADLVRARRGTTLTPLGFGRYEVAFAHLDRPCAFLATVGDPGNALVFNPAGVYTGTAPDGRSVYVETKNPGGGLQDGVPFHLVALCSEAPKTRIAVVKSDGLIDRGSRNTSSFRSATGMYTIVTNRDIAGCATIATRGSVDTAVPFFPTTVETVPGPAPNTIGIQMRELLFFGGNPFDDAFHTAIVCK